MWNGPYAETCCLLGCRNGSYGTTFVAMMQATDMRKAIILSAVGGCFGRAMGQSLSKGEMCSAIMMILETTRQDLTQLTLVENDDVIETSTAAGFTAIMCGFRFSVHTAGTTAAARASQARPLYDASNEASKQAGKLEKSRLQSFKTWPKSNSFIFLSR